MVQKVTMYECDFCHEAFVKEIDCATHELDCEKNPTMLGCPTCKYETVDCEVQPTSKYIYDCKYWEPKEDEQI